LMARKLIVVVGVENAAHVVREDLKKEKEVEPRDGKRKCSRVREKRFGVKVFQAANR
jgi:hypothetical protein